MNKLTCTNEQLDIQSFPWSEVRYFRVHSQLRHLKRPLEVGISGHKARGTLATNMTDPLINREQKLRYSFYQPLSLLYLSSKSRTNSNVQCSLLLHAGIGQQCYNTNRRVHLATATLQMEYSQLDNWPDLWIPTSKGKWNAPLDRTRSEWELKGSEGEMEVSNSVCLSKL